MKGNIKKLAVFVMIAAITTFMTVPTASAWWPRDTLWGQYAVTGSGVCVQGASPFDTTNDLFLLGGFTSGKVQGYSQNVFEGVYNFRTDGTGTFEGTLRFLSFNVSGPFFGASATTHWTFNYSVSADGDITFTDTVQKTTFTSGPPFLPRTEQTSHGGPLHGKISFDRYHLTVTCGPTPIAEWPPEETPYINAGGGLCIINLAGQRK